MSRRVVITSIGVCSSLGFSLNQVIDNLKKGRICFMRPSFDDNVVISPVLNFNLKNFIGRFKDRRYLNRGAQFCVAAAIRAIDDAGIEKRSLSDAGLFIGTGPNLDISGEFTEKRRTDLACDDLMALWMLRFLPNTAASAIARLAGIHGENLTINTACAASLQAVGEAFRKIKEGFIDMALAGGGDSRISPGGILAYKKANAIFTGNGDPEKSSRPFDMKRNGFVPGEGGAVFLLEDMAHALKRGAPIYAEIRGYGSSLDGYNMTAPDPDASWSEKSVRSALREADMLPYDIEVVSAHGTGTVLNDETEANLLYRIFAERTPYVIAIKSWIGHIAAACGALELAVVLACMKNNYLPEIRNLEEPCHPQINFMRNGMEYNAGTVMLENFGFGGQNSALIISKV